jgi:hypothetical protein
MVFKTYVCDDFKMKKSGTLTIYGLQAEFKTNEKDMVTEFIKRNNYDAVVCPAIFKDENGLTPKKIIFKN